MRPESQGRAMEAFFLMEPSEGEAGTSPFNCNRECLLKSGFLCVCGWQCLVPAGLVGFGCLAGGGHFLRVLG